MDNKFPDQRNIITTERLRKVLDDLPGFCKSFFLSIENTTSTLTRYGYAIDLRTFFNYLILKEDGFQRKKVFMITIDDMNNLNYECIERFLSYVDFYISPDKARHSNRSKAKARKLSCIRALFKYLFKRDKIESNVASKVEMPKTHDQPILRLEPNEVAKLLDEVESGESLTKNQTRYADKTRLRDMAIISVFLGTGIRVSELVGLDMSDIDFENNAFLITRKGGDQVILYFGKEVLSALVEYFEWRKSVFALEGSENALFLSLQLKRISVRAVQNMVKKFSKAAIPLKKISPHKLRSTFGTSLYEQTNDIYLVADVLGHRDVNTTKKHYAAQSDENRRKAAKVIVLRDDE